MNVVNLSPREEVLSRAVSNIYSIYFPRGYSRHAALETFLSHRRPIIREIPLHLTSVSGPCTCARQSAQFRISLFRWSSTERA